MHLTDELELWGLRQARQHDVYVDLLDNLLLQALEANHSIYSCREETDGFRARKVPNAEKRTVTRTASFLGVSVETLVEDRAGRRYIRRLFMSKDWWRAQTCR